MVKLAGQFRRLASACVLPLVRCAARSYIAGPRVEDALRVAADSQARGFATTLGYWDGAGDHPRGVADKYLRDIELLADVGQDAYESIKFPGLRMSETLVEEVLARGAEKGVRVHFDALEPEAADATWKVVATAVHRGQVVSSTLPGRWRRSLADADQAIELGIPVRVVKGQWPDPLEPENDPAAGFLNIVRRLAGRANHVAMATHNPSLADEALQILRAAGTSCELELLHGLPWRAPVNVARRQGVRVRLYIPYGEAYLPYCLSQARRNPSVLWRLVRDSCRNVFGRTADIDRHELATFPE